MKNLKNIFLYKLSLGVLSLMVFSLALSSCNDDGDISGAPVITKIYMLDTVVRHRDSTFMGAEPNTLLVVKGQNIGGITHAYFNGYETSFNTNYNTDTDLIIRVPAEAPTDSTADNKLRLVTSHGETTYDFKIIAKPSISSFDRLNYGEDAGRDITFKGKNFADMEKVVAYREKETPTEIVLDSVICQIVSKSKDKIVVRIPSNTISRATLNFTNSSGTTKTNDVFVNTDVAFKIFTEAFVPGFGNSSWGDPLVVNSDFAYSGKKSASKNYAKGNWHLAGFGWGWLPYDASYKYITFAIKGGSASYTLYLGANSMSGGDVSAFVEKNKVEVVAKVWNYYKLAIKDIDFWAPGKNFQVIGFRIKGPDKQDEVFYFDDVMLVK